MKSAILIAFVCAMLPGCGSRPGRLRDVQEFKWRHESVRWVYHTGSQLIQPIIPHFLAGPTWPLPARIQSEIIALRASDDCVFVTEGLPLVNANHISLGLREVRLDVQTGRATNCTRFHRAPYQKTFNRHAAAACESEAVKLHFADLDNGFALTSGCHRHPHPICIGPRHDVWFKLADWEATAYDWDEFGLLYDEIGPVSNVVSVPDRNVIIVSSGLLSVVCIDLNLIPALAAGRAPFKSSRRIDQAPPSDDVPESFSLLHHGDELHY